jgi:hypothetical protein
VTEASDVQEKARAREHKPRPHHHEKNPARALADVCLQAQIFSLEMAQKTKN